MFKLIGIVCLLPALLLAWLWPRYDYLPSVELPFRAERVGDSPLVHEGLSARLAEVSGGEERYVNINGPSLIRVPSWVENPLGRYYLYFAHHKGDHIRLAYADAVEGPWTVYEPGALSLSESGFADPDQGAAADQRGLATLWENFSLPIVRDMLILSYHAQVEGPRIRKERGLQVAANSKPHIASPDVWVDHENQRIVMYYHGLAGKVAQHTRVAVSPDGLHFTMQPGQLHSNYLRSFHHRGKWYGLAMPGILYRSPDGLADFEPRKRLLFEPRMRHAGLWLQGDTLYVFWSRVGDSPEAILVSTVDLGPVDWNEWYATEGVELLRPELPWEGSELPVQPSIRGELDLAAHELRDPYVYVEGDEVWLLYTGAAEQAIGLARIIDQ